MELCSRCKKRAAVAYVVESNICKGLCIRCARELNIKTMDEIIKKMGLSEEDLERIDVELENMMELEENEGESSDAIESGDAAIVLYRMFMKIW